MSLFQPTPAQVALVRHAWSAVAFCWPEVPPEQGCLYHAFTSLLALWSAGYRDYILQGGTAQWLRMDAEHDDGEGPNLFGYVFEPDSPITMARLAAGLLPEMHVWLVDPHARVICDPSSWAFPAACRRLQGLDWRAPRPPDILWAEYDRGIRARYVADPLACHVVEVFARRLLAEQPGLLSLIATLSTPDTPHRQEPPCAPSSS